MDEKQLLDAIRTVVREETAVQTEVIEKRLSEVESGLAGVKAGQTNLESGLAEVKAGQTNLESDLAEVKAGQTKLEISYENHTQQILNLLREDYSRVASAAAKTADYDEVKSQVSEHQSALENHNQRIVELEKAAI